MHRPLLFTVENEVGRAERVVVYTRPLTPLITSINLVTYEYLLKPF